MAKPDIDRIILKIKDKGVQNPYAAVILGSGLGDFANQIENRIDIPYDEIPGMPKVTVAGHAGTLYCGTVAGKEIIAFGGRFHSYEGHGLETTLTPVHISSVLGVKLLLISNAAGGVNLRLSIGDLMLINDMMSPGYGYALPGRPSHIRYDNKHVRSRILQIAADCGIPLQHGTYFYAKGPTYETKAEVRACRIMGADVVGMSTAPEILEATRLGIESIGISLVTNMGTGVNIGKLDHSEVKETAETRKEDFARLVIALIERY